MNVPLLKNGRIGKIRGYGVIGNHSCLKSKCLLTYRFESDYPQKSLEKFFKIVYNISINEVEEFIKTFLNKNNLPRELEIQFVNGFYYNFILMLKKPFNRGEIV